MNHQHVIVNRAAYLYMEATQGDPNAIYRTLSPDFCYYAMRAGPNDPLSAAANPCQNTVQQTEYIYNNL